MIPEPSPGESHFPESHDDDRAADPSADRLDRDDASPSHSRPMMRLDDVLKRGGLAGTGGQAKVWIQDGHVRVNGEIETRRRKQVFLGDQIQVLGQSITLDESFFLEFDEN